MLLPRSLRDKENVHTSVALKVLYPPFNRRDRVVSHPVDPSHLLAG